MARIIARTVGCTAQGLLEVDAATHSGVDNMRDILTNVRYRALGRKPTKVIIVDECHALSQQTWQSLLLSIEEPPEHVYWCLCTTQEAKVPATIKTRCHSFELRSVAANLLFDYLELIAKEEGIEIDESVLQVCAKQAGGSVRQALVNLSTVVGCDDRKEAFRLLASVAEEGTPVELARLLVNGTNWMQVRPLLEQLRDENPESVRLIVTAYCTRVLLDVKDQKRVPALMRILDAFSQPFNSTDKIAPVLLAVGGILYG